MTKKLSMNSVGHLNNETHVNGLHSDLDFTGCTTAHIFAGFKIFYIFHRHTQTRYAQPSPVLSVACPKFDDHQRCSVRF